MTPVGDFPEMLDTGSHLRWEGPGGPLDLEVESSRPHGPARLVTFAGYGALDRARELCGGRLNVPRERLVIPDAEFILDADLQQYSCVSATGEHLGEAEAFERIGPACYLRMRRGGRTILVPYTRPVVTAISHERRQIMLDPPDGLWDV